MLDEAKNFLSHDRFSKLKTETIFFIQEFLEKYPCRTLWGISVSNLNDIGA